MLILWIKSVSLKSGSSNTFSVESISFFFCLSFYFFLRYFHRKSTIYRFVRRDSFIFVPLVFVGLWLHMCACVSVWELAREFLWLNGKGMMKNTIRWRREKSKKKKQNQLCHCHHCSFTTEFHGRDVIISKLINWEKGISVCGKKNEWQTSNN